MFWKGIDRAERFCEIIQLFHAEGIETEADLKEWLLASEANLSKLRRINGIGPKTVDYFKILVGISTSAIDRHLLKFLEMAGIQYSSYEAAQAIINNVADILNVERAKFDHSIWQYMSQRGEKMVCSQ